MGHKQLNQLIIVKLNKQELWNYYTLINDHNITTLGKELLCLCLAYSRGDQANNS